ncbi:hypothetical protein THIOM_003797 [Candidatus Thiomargarita nelsonii]|uniref:Uncharacterized protein n=1 Tax=Candidatus Thiomargarita nelsonii TaxID=1003181 RepID=A0A176RXS6_9GAMM|nr:hypothetical protein THIOM_003797 [Candidatus Thiomargarita nelsonii]
MSWFAKNKRGFEVTPFLFYIEALAKLSKNFFLSISNLKKGYVIILNRKTQPEMTQYETFRKPIPILVNNSRNTFSLAFRRTW